MCSTTTSNFCSMFAKLTEPSHFCFGASSASCGGHLGLERLQKLKICYSTSNGYFLGVSVKSILCFFRNFKTKYLMFKTKTFRQTGKVNAKVLRESIMKKLHSEYTLGMIISYYQTKNPVQYLVRVEAIFVLCKAQQLWRPS